MVGTEYHSFRPGSEGCDGASDGEEEDGCADGLPRDEMMESRCGFSGVSCYIWEDLSRSL